MWLECSVVVIGVTMTDVMEIQPMVATGGNVGIVARMQCCLFGMTNIPSLFVLLMDVVYLV